MTPDGLRLVCAKRKRKLRKRGHRVWWSVEYQSWAWRKDAQLSKDQP